MAERLCSLAKKSGNSAVWYLEESSEHPVHSKLLKETRRNSSIFTEACLLAWSRFAEKCQSDNVLHILEGSALQSTVRFMMEERIADIGTYYQRYEEIVACLNPCLVYLRPRDPIQHSKYTSGFRGGIWNEKVASYLEKTSYSKYKGLTGVCGMHQFWADYAMLCDSLVLSSKMPVKTISVMPGDWERHMCEAAEFLDIPFHSDVKNALRCTMALNTDSRTYGST